MIPKKEISKDPRLNDIILELQEEIPALDGYTGEEGSGIKIIIQPFLFSAPYRVGERIYLARIDSLGFDPFPANFVQYGERKIMNVDGAKYFTTEYFKRLTLFSSRFIDPHSRIEFSEITTAIYGTPQPALDGYLRFNAFEVKGMLKK